MHSEISLGGNINNGVENPENKEQQGSGISETNEQQQRSGISENHEQQSMESENKEKLRGEREISEDESENRNAANVDVEAKQEEKEEKEEKADEEEYYDDIWDDYEYDYLEETEPQVTKRPTVDFARWKFRSNT